MLKAVLLTLFIYVIVCYVWGGYVATRLLLIGRKRRRPLESAENGDLTGETTPQVSGRAKATPRDRAAA